MNLKLFCKVFHENLLNKLVRFKQRCINSSKCNLLIFWQGLCNALFCIKYSHFYIGGLHAKRHLAVCKMSFFQNDVSVGSGFFISVLLCCVFIFFLHSLFSFLGMGLYKTPLYKVYMQNALSIISSIVFINRVRFCFFSAKGCGFENRS